jgi:hypothetical protein
VLAAWDGIGRHTEQVRHHPSHAAAGRSIHATGVMSADAEAGPDGTAAPSACPTRAAPHRSIRTLFHLTAQAGEAWHHCPLRCRCDPRPAACGHTRPARFLPGLLDRRRSPPHRLAVPHRAPRGPGVGADAPGPLPSGTTTARPAERGCCTARSGPAPTPTPTSSS